MQTSVSSYIKGEGKSGLSIYKVVTQKSGLFAWILKTLVLEKKVRISLRPPHPPHPHVHYATHVHRRLLRTFEQDDPRSAIRSPVQQRRAINVPPPVVGPIPWRRVAARPHTSAHSAAQRRRGDGEGLDERAGTRGGLAGLVRHEQTQEAVPGVAELAGPGERDDDDEQRQRDGGGPVDPLREGHVADVGRVHAHDARDEGQRQEDDGYDGEGVDGGFLAVFVGLDLPEVLGGASRVRGE
jgi:hypothetical protein